MIQHLRKVTTIRLFRPEQIAAGMSEWWVVISNDWQQVRKPLWCIMTKTRWGLPLCGILKIKSKVSRVSLDASWLVAVSNIARNARDMAGSVAALGNDAPKAHLKWVGKYSRPVSLDMLVEP